MSKERTLKRLRAQNAKLKRALAKAARHILSAADVIESFGDDADIDGELTAERELAANFLTMAGETE